MYYENKLWILIEYCEGGALDDIIEKIDHGKGLQTILNIYRGSHISSVIAWKSKKRHNFALD